MNGLRDCFHEIHKNGERRAVLLRIEDKGPRKNRIQGELRERDT
jgi:hypothetical protein